MQTDDDFMRIALEEAREAYRCGEVPVGAVLVLEGNVLAQAHNSPIMRNDPSAHAEMLALRQVGEKIGNYRLAGAELYVTLEPCVMCAGALVQARVEEVIYGAADPKAGALDSHFRIASSSQLNHRIAVTSGILEPECSARLRAFFASRRYVAPD